MDLIDETAVRRTILLGKNQRAVAIQSSGLHRTSKEWFSKNQPAVVEFAPRLVRSKGSSVCKCSDLPTDLKFLVDIQYSYR